MRTDKQTLLSILTNYGIDIATEIKQGITLKELLQQRIEELDNQIIKIQNRPDDAGNKSLAIHDAKYEQFILQKLQEDSKK